MPAALPVLLLASWSTVEGLAAATLLGRARQRGGAGGTICEDHFEPQGVVGRGSARRELLRGHIEMTLEAPSSSGRPWLSKDVCRGGTRYKGSSGRLPSTVASVLQDASLQFKQDFDGSVKRIAARKTRYAATVTIPTREKQQRYAL